MSDFITVAELRIEAERLCDENEYLLAENAKLVDVLHEVETEAVYAYHCLQQDCVTTANNSEHFFKKWWHAECETDHLKAENTKLRELVEVGLRCCDHKCDGCKFLRCGLCHIDEFEDEARKLGVEVTG